MTEQTFDFQVRANRVRRIVHVRLHGARGHLEEYGVERQLRDSIGGVLYAGTSDIQRNLISSLLGL